jgi:hypothetical protein
MRSACGHFPQSIKGLPRWRVDPSVVTSLAAPRAAEVGWRCGSRPAGPISRCRRHLDQGPRRTHGSGGADSHGALLRHCIFNEAGDLAAPSGRSHMRVVNGGMSRMRCSVERLRNGAPLVRDRSRLGVWNGPGSRPGQVREITPPRARAASDPETPPATRGRRDRARRGRRSGRRGAWRWARACARGRGWSSGRWWRG